MASKFYTLQGKSVRLDSVIAVTEPSHEDYMEKGEQHGFHVYFDATESWWIGYDKPDMATAQRAKLMEALEEEI